MTACISATKFFRLLPARVFVSNVCDRNVAERVVNLESGLSNVHLVGGCGSVDACACVRQSCNCRVLLVGAVASCYGTTLLFWLSWR